MGWQEGRAIGRGGKGEVVAKELVRRPQRLGLGATPAPETHQKKYIKPGGLVLICTGLFLRTPHTYTVCSPQPSQTPLNCPRRREPGEERSGVCGRRGACQVVKARGQQAGGAAAGGGAPRQGVRESVCEESVRYVVGGVLEQQWEGAHPGKVHCFRGSGWVLICAHACAHALAHGRGGGRYGAGGAVHG